MGSKSRRELRIERVAKALATRRARIQRRKLKQQSAASPDGSCKECTEGAPVTRPLNDRRELRIECISPALVARSRTFAIRRAHAEACHSHDGSITFAYRYPCLYD